MVSKFDESFIALTNLLVQIQRDFDYIPGDILETAVLENGAIKTEEESYKALILPPMDTISKKSWQKIVSYIVQGGIVFALEILPEYTTDGENIAEEVKKYFPPIKKNRLFSYMGFPGGAKTYFIKDIEDIENVLQMEINSDLSLAERKDPEILYCHRNGTDYDIYFIANNSTKKKELKIEFASQGKVELWDPYNGDTLEIGVSELPGNRTSIDLSLGGFDGKLIVFDRKN
jgi:hypothetical protein